MDWYSEGAPRNLSADQFMSVKSLTKIPSLDYPNRPNLNVGDKLFDLGHYPKEAVANLSQHIQNQTIDPVHVAHPQQLARDYYGNSADLTKTYHSESPLALGNGGHRTALSTQFKNVHRLPVTPDRKVSQGDERESREREKRRSKLDRMMDVPHAPPDVSLGTALKRYAKYNG